MSATIISQVGSELIVQVKINLSGTMLEMEEKIMEACNEVGSLSTQASLECFDKDGSPLVMGDIKYTMRTKDNREYQTPYGTIQVNRHVYQSSAGGKVYIPMEDAARIIHGATPKFAKMLSHKYAAMSAQDVLDDLSMNHKRKISKKYLQLVSGAIANIVQTKMDTWEYETPVFDTLISSATISMDGAMLPTSKEGWRESMVGTISLYNSEGYRQHTIYVGEAPEYGKANFMNRMNKEINKIKMAYPNLLYIGIADGAKDNWPFLEKHTDKQLLDFYHVTEYLAEVSCAAHPEITGKLLRKEWLEKRCHELKHGRDAPKNILEELKRFRYKKNLTREMRENLMSAITYFQNNIHRMNYAEHIESNLPIGSGVTEAACKTLIKERFCQSGMRWKNPGIKTVLCLRESLQTTGRWQQLWQKINQYGISYAA